MEFDALLQSFLALIFRLHYFSFLGLWCLCYLLGLWYEIETSNINTKPLKLRSFGFIFWVYFMRSKLFSFLFFSFFTFAFFFSFKFGFLCRRNAGSRSDIVPIVWVLFCFLETKNWVQVWVPNKNLSEIKKKKKRK